MTARHGAGWRSRPRSLAGAAAVVLAIVTAGVIFAMTRVGASKPAAEAPRTASTSAPAPSASPTSTPAVGRIPPIPGGPTGPAHPDPRATVSVGPPVRVTIPSIGVDSSLEALGLLPDKSLQTPAQWGVAGWYAGGVRPGDPGPAVIAGHVDSTSGPAVFYRLRDLQVGADVYVTTQSGRRLHFVVDRRQQFPKTQFPTEAVYGPTPLPVLRLITCTGAFDADAHSYLDNLIVTAHLTGAAALP
jgi:Sortase domain